MPTPDTDADTDADADPLARVHALTQHTLTGLQHWLTRPDTDHSELIILTRHAVSIDPHDHIPDLAHAAAWALIHTTQNEHPGRIRLLDTDTTTTTGDHLATLLAAWPHPHHLDLHTQPQLALRHGITHTPRLTPTTTLTPPPGPHWELVTTGKGDLAHLALVPAAPPSELAPGQIRVAVRAAGLNFRDVVVALGAIAEDGLGGEAAGIILDVAADVTAFRRGDAVMGLFPQNAFAPTAVTDHRMVVALPAGWSMPSAASVPVAVLTAYASLIEVGGLRAGQRVLIHAGAGGVGQAAIQIARHLGAEVYATAHPNKHHVLHQLGIADDHIASSRTLDFADKFTQTTGGRGMDLVLNSLTGDFVDRSLDLLGPGGCLVEIGKTDIRQPHAVATTHPGVSYHTYDLSKESPERASQLWQGVVEMITAGALHPLPTTSYGLLQAPRALRHMSQARHTGKIVLVPPPVFTPEGSVLITGGTGTLGALFAEHLITHYGVRHLLLVSRRGPQSPGATELSAHLNALGAQVTISAADTSNPTELAALLAAIPPAHPLTAIIHTAAVLQDAVLTELTPDQLHSVLTAKADTAWHLHHLTRHLPLDAFILFSSAAGVLGSPGQANYAAANAFLDALAHHRHHHHQPATSLSWGYWQTTSAMTAHLDSTDQARLTRNHLAPITTDHGLALFDTALTYHRPHLIPAPLNHHSLTRHARQHGLAPLLSALTTTRRQASTTPTHHSLHTQLATQTPAQQHATLLALVTTTTATVLAHPDASALDPDQPFKDLGIDSLSALELRNTMAQHAGLTLPATLIFDHPTPTALTHYLYDKLGTHTTSNGVDDPDELEMQQLIETIPAKQLIKAGVLNLLRDVARSEHSFDTSLHSSDVESMSLDDLLVTLGDHGEENAQN
ncbi:SDR family NAD(P)-dependent oxidoreductase [Mycobacterium szulgai]|uniref:SDR family NAD(P)-dependent oxidoreductase n=2 Tax=Mycobacterium szulgai TaxID=1787 RepID=UPI0021F2FA27|nr:SDR family NAD(P)-dependent oxidoreductase [Mycobacterium szulgai]MCV7074504.1 SDR family NAD(P)-dependent oxidoreductase [Mycobacterium szulgai]